MSGKKPLILMAQKCFMLEDQVERLNSFGKVHSISMKRTTLKILFKQLNNAQVIIAKNEFLDYDKLYELSDLMIIIPFGRLDFWDKIDHEKLKCNNIIVKHIPRQNQESVSEWVVFMMLALSRNLHELIRTEESVNMNIKPGWSLYGKRVAILGKGRIGSHLGQICESFCMDVTYYVRGEGLLNVAEKADFVVNCLGFRPDLPKALSSEFFRRLKRGCYFINVASPSTYDQTALLQALEDGILAGAAGDVPGAHIDDANDPMYRKILSHPKMLVTPHIAWRTDREARVSFDMMIDAIEEYLNKEGR